MGVIWNQCWEIVDPVEHVKLDWQGTGAWGVLQSVSCFQPGHGEVKALAVGGNSAWVAESPAAKDESRLTKRSLDGL